MQLKALTPLIIEKRSRVLATNTASYFNGSIGIEYDYYFLYIYESMMVRKIYLQGSTGSCSTAFRFIVKEQKAKTIVF